MVQLLNGEFKTNTLLLKPKGQPEYVVADYGGWHFLDLVISSPQTQTNFKTRTGIDGSTQSGPVLFTSRIAKANFFLETVDEYHFERKTHEIYQRVFSRDIIRIRESNNIGMCVYGIAKPFEFTHLSYLDKTFTIEFDLVSAYRYSVVRSTDFPLDLEAGDMVSSGMNFNSDMFSYTFDISSGDRFKVFNPSDIDIQPYMQDHELNIEFVGTGSPNLVNRDTESSFSYNKQLKSNDTLVLKGVHPFLNGKPCEIDTNHGDIDLAKNSWNEFSITGFTGKIIFDFPFIYY